mmetsp:Transcript_6482/g.13074  ORF Transcript_6482/g.13074 Transcript_6482/m.13074 type:complete len:240 (+) Transcript_6482:205-924(+)
MIALRLHSWSRRHSQTSTLSSIILPKPPVHALKPGPGIMRLMRSASSHDASKLQPCTTLLFHDSISEQTDGGQPVWQGPPHRANDGRHSQVRYPVQLAEEHSVPTTPSQTGTQIAAVPSHSSGTPYPVTTQPFTSPLKPEPRNMFQKCSTLLVSQLIRSWSKAGVFASISDMSRTLLTSQREISPLKILARANMAPMSVTLLVFHPDKSPLKPEFSSNIRFIMFTLPTFQPDTSPLKSP